MGRKDDVMKKLDKLVDQVQCQDGIKAGQCDYANMLGRCSLPGTMSQEAHGGGQWHCRFHYQQLFRGLSEEESAIKRRAGKPKDWREFAIEAKIAGMRDDPLMQMAQRLVGGGCSREDKADFLGLLRNRIKGIGQNLPYEKALRAGELCVNI